MASIGDWLFEMTDWLRTTSVVEFSLWISDQPFCIWLQSNFFAIPVFQALHILAIAVLFGSTLLLNLRILGLSGMDQSMTDRFARYQPWIWGGLLALVASGTVLIISEPVRNMVNPIFWMKMGALLVTIAVSLWFQSAVRARVDNWEVSADGHAAIRTGAVALIVLWCVVITGGRWIAYAPV
ncbi:MAG TPA: DUF6644 family protein [Sphingobium sp.]|nr:DUF6644 family protein [Sphingobium sp.]